MKTFLVTALAALAGFFSAQADLLVYDLSFNTSGKSVNYSFLEGGFLVVDENTSAVTSIVVLTDPETRLAYYTTGLMDGTYMRMLEEGSNSDYAVIYGTGGNSTSNSTSSADNIAFQILGKTTKKVDVGDGTGLRLAKKLSGYLLASAPQSTSVDSSQIVTFTYGFAGSSKVTSNFQSDLTSQANNNRLTAASEMEILTAILTERGIVPEPTPTPTASPTATP